jgi:LPS-assembly protein
MRLSSELGWERRDILSGGFVNTVSTSVRADGYYVPERDLTLLGSGGDGNNTATRFTPYVYNVTSYPLAKTSRGVDYTIEPTLAIRVSPNLKNNTEIPNEDSQDVQIDSNNIFNADRFPGIDRVEDRSHITYGIRTGAYAKDGSFGDVFLGQSYRLDNKDNPFPIGSGLDERSSNYVGQISGRYKTNLNLNYKFEIDEDDLNPNRHELDANLFYGKFGFGATYLFTRGLEGTDLTTSREQLFTSASYQMTSTWRVGTSARYELSDTVDSGFRGGALSLDYIGQCLTLSTIIDRDTSDSVSGEQALEIKMRIGLKNLGEFGIAQ